MGFWIGWAKLTVRSRRKGLRPNRHLSWAAIPTHIVAGVETNTRARHLPAKKRNDARHVAAATLGGADVLVSWNYRHLVRPRKAEQFCAINLVRGYNSLLEISTPSEILHGPRKDD